MSISKIIVFFLVVFFVSPCLVNFNTSTFAQIETGFNTTTSSEAVTSVNDAILKSLVIVSQVAVLGIIFNCFFFNKFQSRKRDGSNNKNLSLNYSNQQNVYFNTRTLKRVTLVVVLCCVSITFFSTCIILLQSNQLSQNLDLDIYSAFNILYTTSVGHVWLLRIATSSAITALMIISYYLSGIRVRTTQSNINSLGKFPENKVSYFSNNKLDQIFLLVVMIISSINLFSNSMVSHSNSLSSFSTLAVSMDWIHFLAVSVWIGGLFYLSLIILRNIEPVDYDGKSNSNVTVSDVYNNIVNVRNISLFLMNFSFIAIIALCIIGISGLYLGYVHLQDLNSIFSTTYGQILLLKLGLAFPLIFIGRYNQDKIFKHTLLISNLVKNINNNNPTESLSHRYRENRSMLFRALCRSLRIESALGIAVLIVASFLSVTSPPSLEVVTGDSYEIQTYNTNESGNSLFFYLVITVTIIISVIAIVNFRNNQKKIKKILISVDGGY